MRHTQLTGSSSRQAGWPGTPFRIETPDAVLEDLRERLLRTRFPQQQLGPDWSTGTPLDYCRRLRDHWLEKFDWRACEAEFNRYDQRMVEVDGHSIHLVIERGSGAHPQPLLVTHGWPGSFVEYLPVIDRLAHPERHGGRAEDAFTIILPSLPGYGYSPAPAQSMSPSEIAGLWSRLMTGLLGFESYVAFGSDWGSLVTSRLAFDYPDRLAAFLITTPGGIIATDENTPLSLEEIAWQQKSHSKLRPESAYQLVQATKPQSLAYGQTDSPIGLAAWIIEKFHGWTINGQQADPPFPMDDLLANIMVYWINGCLAPMWLYSQLSSGSMIGTAMTDVPAGFIFAPGDMTPPAPRAYLERAYRVEHYRVLPRGGHFPGMEIPEDLVQGIAGFLGKYR